MRKPLPRKLEFPGEWSAAREVVQDVVRDLLEHIRKHPRVETLPLRIRGGQTISLRLEGYGQSPAAVLMIGAHEAERADQTAIPTAVPHWAWNPGTGTRAGSVSITAPAALTDGVDYDTTIMVVDISGAQ